MRECEQANKTHSFLKAATSDAHRQLDASLNAGRFFENEQGYAEYLTLMQSLYHFCATSTVFLEARDPRFRREVSLLSLIRRDCASLSHGASDLWEALPVPATSCEPESVHWGRCYVIEGSSLGAAFIVKKLARRLPDHLEYHFLHQLTVDAETRWPLFKSLLDDAGIDQRGALQGAQQVFDYALRQSSIASSSFSAEDRSH